MTESPRLDETAIRRRRRKVRLASLEADVAYFQARLEILGEPETANQWAQRRAYELLRNSLGELVLQTKRRLIEDDLGSS